MVNSYMWLGLWSGFGILLMLSGCSTPMEYLSHADAAAYAIIAQKQVESGENTQPQEFIIAPPGSVESQLRQRLLLDQHLPTTENLAATAVSKDGARPVKLSLIEALQVAAHNNRDYQLNKEQVFRKALALDLQQEQFRNSFSSLLSSMWSTTKEGSERVGGLTHKGIAGWQRTFKSGVAFATSIGFDLVQLLTANRVSARGIVADASISIPLLRGAGEKIVTEPLHQAERDVVYALWDFERYRRSFAVQIASEYLLVLERMNRVDIAEDNYRRLLASRQRAQRLADAGRLTQIQVGQAQQDELRAHSSWVRAQQDSAERLDSFKMLLGLPTDSDIVLDREALHTNSLASAPAGEQLSPEVSQRLVRIALKNRRDLKVARARVVDSRRAVVVAEDKLGADVTLLGSGSAGSNRTLASADSDDAHLDLDHGTYSALLSVDLPIERTAERNALRSSWIDWSVRKRELAQLEDTIKLQVRSAWRGGREAFDMVKIQAQALEVAQRRVNSTNLFLRAGRIQMRDLLEAQDALMSTNNAVVEAQVQYRIRMLELKRDLGVLQLDSEGRWLEDDIDYDSVVQK